MTAADVAKYAFALASLGLVTVGGALAIIGIVASRAADAVDEAQMELEQAFDERFPRCLP